MVNAVTNVLLPSIFLLIIRNLFIDHASVTQQSSEKDIHGGRVRRFAKSKVQEPSRRSSINAEERGDAESEEN